MVENEGYDDVELDEKAKTGITCEDAITTVKERPILSFTIEIAS